MPFRRCTIGFLANLAQEVQRNGKVPHCLGMARARHCQVARPLPILDRNISLSGLCEVMRHEFGLGAYDFREMGLVRCCDPSMQLLAVSPKQSGICNILHQCVLEGILCIGWRTTPEEKLSANKLLQRIV